MSSTAQILDKKTSEQNKKKEIRGLSLYHNELYRREYLYRTVTNNYYNSQINIYTNHYDNITSLKPEELTTQQTVVKKKSYYEGIRFKKIEEVD